MTTDGGVFLTEINQEIQIGASFGVKPGRYFVTSSLVMRRKNRLFILGYLIVQGDEILLANAARDT